jgi:hypothetical protein
VGGGGGKGAGFRAFLISLFRKENTTTKKSYESINFKMKNKNE